jgi:amino acid transporter
MTNTRGAMPRRQLTLLPLIAAIFFMVSGGPYGLEEIIQKAGYSKTILILAIVPFLWSLPVALMVGELSAALPEEGGYYEWVRRAMGNFWGFQEAWLSLAASVFDMAIYPTIFVLYLGQAWPSAVAGHRYVIVGCMVVVVCALWNITGVKAVGHGGSIMMFALLAPFVVLAGYCLFGAAQTRMSVPHLQHGSVNLLGGIVIAMWNYMGWDNASTVAGEVRNPQRNYPLALFGAVALIATCYIIPVAALARTGIDPSGFTTGSWVQVANRVAMPLLGWAIVAGGMICGLGMNNALVLSYSRVPYAMAEHGMLPNVLAKTNRFGVPWVSVIVCAIAWMACLPLGFDRLIAIDIMIYALSLLLEFVALIVLRYREPGLERPFKIPGGIAAIVALMLGPTFVLIAAMIENRGERAGPLSTFVLGAIVIVVGVVVYPLVVRRRNGIAASQALPESE